MNQDEKKVRWVKYGCIFVAFLIYFSLSCFLPIKKAPDEPLRYMIPEYILNHHSLPIGTDMSITDKTWGFSYGLTPYLPSMFAAGIMWLVSFFSSNTVALVVASRFISVLAATGSLALGFLIGEKLFSKARSSFLFALIVGFLPQFVFLSAYLNNDAFAVFTAMLILYGWLLGKERHWDYKSCLFLAVGISACILTYYNAYGWVLCSVFYFFGTIWLDAGIERKWKHSISHGCLIAITVALLAGWFFVRNAILYQGDFLGMRTLNECAEQYAYGPYKPSNRVLFSTAGLSVVDMLRQTDWLESTIRSFFGVFGYMDIKTSDFIYGIYFVFFLVGGLGFLYGICKKKAKAADLVLYGCSLLCMIIPFGLSIYYSYASDYQAQGRYIMSALPALALLTSCGFQWLEDSDKGKKGSITVAATIVWMLLFVIVFVTVMLPRLYGGVANLVY